jgi:hypothetical protein
MDNPLPQAQAVLSTTAARWQHLAEVLPADLLSRPAAPGEWAALDCLRHLLDAERLVFPVRLQALLAGQDFVPFDPNREGAKHTTETPQQMAAEFARLRAESLVTLAKVTVDDLPRRARHPEFGLVTLVELLHTWPAHDLNHTMQAERALMQPFMLGSGPWRKFFQDHEFKETHGA